MLSLGPRAPVIWLAALLVMMPVNIVNGGELPIIDAHSQMDHQVDPDRIVPVLDEAGVSHVILAPRGKLKEKTFLAFAVKHPDRITPSIRTKSGKFEKNKPAFYKNLKKSLATSTHRAMAEVILWHAAKNDKAGQRVVPPDAPQVQAALKGALKKNWPFVIHIEFGEAGRDRATFMTKMEALLSAHPDHPFALIHMGQLEAPDVRRLIEAHGNIHFITSKASPAFANSKIRWINMFAGTKLKPAWKDLMTAHPDRFILALDNVWAEDWGSRFINEVALWRKALGELPDDVAHAVAHGNAERLWRLMPAK